MTDYEALYRIAESLDPEGKKRLLTLLSRDESSSTPSIRKQLQGLIQVATQINRTLNLSLVLRTGLETIIRDLQMDGGAVFLLDEETQSLHLTYAMNLPVEYQHAIRNFKLGEALIGRVAENGKSLFVPNLSNHNRALPETKREGKIKSVYFTVMKIREKVVGVMPIGVCKERIFSTQEMEYVDNIATLIALAIDLNRRTMMEKIRSRNTRTLTTIEHILMVEDDLREAASAVLETIRSDLGFDHLVLALKEEDDDKLRIIAQVGYDAERVPEALPSGEGIIGLAARRGEVINIADVTSSPNYIRGLNGVRSEIALPIFSESGEVTGVLNVESTAFNAFTKVEERVLHSVANQLSVAIRDAHHRRERDRYYEELQAAYTGTLHLFVDFLEKSFPYLHGHSKRVADIAQNLALLEGREKKESVTIKIAAQLHDIGKIYLPANLLLKKGALTKEERDVIEEHPLLGSRMTEKVSIFRERVAPAIHHHHEWFDGSGYPDGIKREEIPSGARIISVVDAWDAMVNDRPYRKAYSKDYAVNELQTGRGTQFDPDVVDLFLSHLPELTS